MNVKLSSTYENDFNLTQSWEKICLLKAVFSKHSIVLNALNKLKLVPEKSPLNWSYINLQLQ